MKILSHRGYWKTPEEKNTEIAFQRSFGLGYGTETDVRDVAGKLVISHDMPKGDEMSFEEFLRLTGDRPLPLALNIKADGLASAMYKALRGSPHEWFVFDASIPDMRQHLNAGNPVYARMSEVERTPAWLSACEGIWLDAFEDIWYEQEDIATLLRRGKRVCVVSPELHKRDHVPLWHMISAFKDASNLMICTDIPEDASAFFNVNP